MDGSELLIQCTPTGRNGMVTATARLGDEVLAVDTLNVTKATARARLVKQVTAGRDGIDGAEIEKLLLQEAARVAAPVADPDTRTSAAEIDTSLVVRPELFHTPDVSGIAVPYACVDDGRPVGRWALYLRWHTDGRRERRELESSIALPDEHTLWLHPVPGSPLATARSGWTERARREWLDGVKAPDPADVFKRVCERLAWFLDFPPEAAAGHTATLALWGMVTYNYPAWRAMPYLNVGGASGSGKSRVFEVLSQFVFRPLQSSNMTAACLFRTLHAQGGVLLLDEAERLRDHAPEAGELRSILLSGYKADSPARRLEKYGDTFRPVAFDVFGPKAIAGIARLPEALASRCIPLPMFRSGPGSSKPRRRIDEHPDVWAELRDDLHALALEHGAKWLELAIRADVCPAMSGRDFELWQPLLALAAWLDETRRVWAAGPDADARCCDHRTRQRRRDARYRRSAPEAPGWRGDGRDRAHAR